MTNSILYCDINTKSNKNLLIVLCNYFIYEM